MLERISPTLVLIQSKTLTLRTQFSQNLQKMMKRAVTRSKLGQNFNATHPHGILKIKRISELRSAPNPQEMICNIWLNYLVCPSFSPGFLGTVSDWRSRNLTIFKLHLDGEVIISIQPKCIISKRSKSNIFYYVELQSHHSSMQSGRHFAYQHLVMIFGLNWKMKIQDSIR